MVKSNQIYMDFAASAEPNPSSIHVLGVSRRKEIDQVRHLIAEFLQARPKEIIFTSGGTEANNLAIQGIVGRWTSENHKSKVRQVPHVITTNIEHPSVLETVKALTARGFISSTIISVESDGVVDPIKIKKAINPNTILVSVMYANNEIGTVQPIAEIAKAIRHYKKISGRENIFLHVDAVQAIHTLHLNVQKLGVDLLTLSGTKIPGAIGSGILFRKNGVLISPIVYGGHQEFGLRPGTENTEAIIKMGSYISKIKKNQEKNNKKLAALQKYFFQKINKTKIFKDSGVLINGSTEHRLPNNINITFPKIPSDVLVLELSSRGIMVSSKSACQNSTDEGSYVISAIRPEIARDIGGLRISFDISVTKTDINYVIDQISIILRKLNKWYH